MPFIILIDTEIIQIQSADQNVATFFRQHFCAPAAWWRLVLVSDKYSSKKIFWKHQNNLFSHRTATFYGRPLPLVIEVVDDVVDEVVDDVVDVVVVAATVA